MPAVRVLTPPSAQAELVSLALLNAHLRLDLDADVLSAYQAGTLADAAVQAQLDLLLLYASAARERVEAYTGRYYAAQTLELTFEPGDTYALPAGATATAVRGFYTDLAALGDSTYLAEYAKGSSVERQLPLVYGLRQTYVVTADVVADLSYQSLAKRAALEVSAEWFRNRETTADARGLLELPLSWRVTLAPARVSVLGESAWD